MLLILDTLDSVRLKEFPGILEAIAGCLADSPRLNVRIGTLELIGSRGLPGFDGQLERISSDAGLPTRSCLRAGCDHREKSTLTNDQFAFLLAPEVPIRCGLAADLGAHSRTIDS